MDVTNPTPGSPGKMTLPALEDLAVQTVQRLAADGYSSSVMKLPRPVLNELGRRLAEPGREVSKIIEWLHAEKDATIPERNIYRFAQRFGEVLKQVIGEHAARMMIAKLSVDPEFQTDDLQRLIKNQVTALVAQEVTTASSPEDIDTSRLNAILSMVMASDKGQLEREKLLLMQGQAEHRAAKAEAEIDKLRQDMKLKAHRIEERVKSLQTRIDELSKAADKGNAIPQSIFDTIRSELTGLSDETGISGVAA